MTILESLTTEELSQKLLDPEIQDVIDFDLDLIIAENAPGSAFRAIKKIEPALTQSKLSSDQLSKYNQYLVLLKFIALQKLNQEEAFGLIASQLLNVLNQGFDLSPRIRSFFSYGSGDFTTVDWLLRSLEANNEPLINNVTFADGKQYAGTIGNLIRLYKNSANFNQGGSLGISNFLSNDKNVKQLDESKIELLRHILSLYDWVRLKALHGEEEGLDALSSIDSYSPPISINIPKPTVPAIPAPPSAPAPMAERTAFEKRLAEISSQSQETHGADLEVLKHKIEESKVDRAPITKPNLVNPVNVEIKREVSTTELPAHPEPKTAAPKPVAPKPAVIKQPVPPPPAPKAPPVARSIPPARPIIQTPSTQGMQLASLDKINTIEDLKKIEPGHLRQGPIGAQVQAIKSKIINLVSLNRIMPYYAVAAFELSPLFKIYLQIGALMMDDISPNRTDAFVSAAAKLGNNLTLDEFEAVADLRKDVERL